MEKLAKTWPRQISVRRNGSTVRRPKRENLASPFCWKLTILIHGPEDLNRILAHVDAGANIKVIWDLMHPWRHDETPERTGQLLAPNFAYAQYKDGIRVAGTNTIALMLPGRGERPLREMQALVAQISAIHDIDDPWISLGWERAWHPELPPLLEAIEHLKAALQLK